LSLLRLISAARSFFPELDSHQKWGAPLDYGDFTFWHLNSDAKGSEEVTSVWKKDTTHIFLRASQAGDHCEIDTNGWEVRTTIGNRGLRVPDVSQDALVSKGERGARKVSLG